MKKNRNIIKVFAFIFIIVCIGGFMYLNNKNKEQYKVITWENYYNENNIEIFYSGEEQRLKVLNETYKIEEIINKEEGELNKILKIIDIVNSVVERDDVSDLGYFNGYDILSKKGESKKISSKDMAIVTRDFISSIGYYARVGEFRADKSLFDKESNFYVVEYWSNEENKWVMIDFSEKGYFEQDGKLCSSIEVLNGDKNKLNYEGKSNKSDYYKQKKQSMKSYTIMIDNTIDMTKSNSVITYVNSKNSIYINYKNKYIGPTIYTKKEDIFNNPPTYCSEEKDEKIYGILMKKEGENNNFIIGGFKDSSIVKNYYVRKNNGNFEEVYKYSEIEINKGDTTIELSSDGVNVESKIQIKTNY